MISHVLSQALVLGLALLLSLSAATNAPNEDLKLAGSKHNFARFGVKESDRCTVCHSRPTPDKEYKAPRWDESPSAGQRFELYKKTAGVPGKSTLLCLSCHDGSTALDAFGGKEGDVYIADIAGPSVVIGKDRDLSGDHPVGVRYPDFDRDYVPQIVVQGEGVVALPGGRVECISCHEPHGLDGHDAMLVKSNVRSALCLTCHRK